MTEYPKNPGKLPVLKLCNKNKPNCPKTQITPLGPLGGKHNKDAKLIKHLQLMLICLGYDLGTTGVDGDFGKLTRNAVIDFQREEKDWEGKKLNEDGLVGPRTADALNRIMVGKWYEHYQTPKKLTKDILFITVSKNALNKGVPLNTKDVKLAKVMICGIKISKYPYIIFSPEDFRFESEDNFTLESNDGPYSETIKFKDAETQPEYCILWFPMPPKKALYTLKVSAERQNSKGDSFDFEYYLFQDEVLTLLNEEEPASSDDRFLR